MPSRVIAHQPAEGAQHHQLALGEAHGFGGLVDQYKAQRDQAVNAPLCHAADQQLKELHIVSLGSAVQL